MTNFSATASTLSSKLDFEQFCSSLRADRPTVDILIVALRSLVASSLRASDRGRYARIIAQFAKDSFQLTELQQIERETWPTEIAMELRRLVPVQDSAPNAIQARTEVQLFAPKSHDEPLAENIALTVLFMGDENEHRASITQLRQSNYTVRCENSLSAVQEAFDQECILGLVVGATWWTLNAEEKIKPLSRLKRILAFSNLCWIKIVRSAEWASNEHEILRAVRDLYFAEPLRTRFAIESSASLTTSEIESLAEVRSDLLYADGAISYDVPVKAQHGRVLRPIISRYLRDNFSATREREIDFDARTLAQRNADDNRILLVSARRSGVAFIVKFAPTDIARDEAERFRLFKQTNSTSMNFFCHGSVGALVLSTVGEVSFRDAQSLEAKIASRSSLSYDVKLDECFRAMDSAVEALVRFSEQPEPNARTRYLCDYESDETGTFVRQCGSVTVGAREVDLESLYRHALKILKNTSRRKTVQHGDAHPGNILFNKSGTAILIDYACAGLAPAGYDLSTLWIHVLAANFIALGSELSLVSMFEALFRGEPFKSIETKWGNELRFATNRQAVYLAHRAIVTSIEKLACTREELYALAIVILCRELPNERFQQFVMRCALTAGSAILSARASS